MITTLALVFIVIGHFVGDFILQTRWQAENKSSSDLALCKHVLTYTLAMTLAIILYGGLNKFNLLQLINWASITYVTHFLTDRITSRLSTIFYKRKLMKWFWVTVGFDQTVHILTLVYTFNYISQ